MRASIHRLTWPIAAMTGALVLMPLAAAHLRVRRLRRQRQRQRRRCNWRGKSGEKRNPARHEAPLRTISAREIDILAA